MALSRVEKKFEVLLVHCKMVVTPQGWLNPARLRRAISDCSHFGSELDLVKELLGQGVAPDIPDGYGFTPLIHAIRSPYTLMVKTLLAAGVNPNHQDDWGYLPLRYAAFNHVSSEMTKMLLSYGADPNLKHKSGQTPLFMAVLSVNSAAIELLLDGGASVPCNGCCGWYAIIFG